jgi:hypothetical protein
LVYGFAVREYENGEQHRPVLVHVQKRAPGLSDVIVGCDEKYQI